MINKLIYCFVFIHALMNVGEPGALAAGLKYFVPQKERMPEKDDAQKSGPTDKIALNQVGFYPHAPKLAVVTGSSGDDFFVVSMKSGEMVYKGKLSPMKQSNNSSLKTRIADFSALQREGVYAVRIPGLGVSYLFKIAANIHHEIAKSALKGFYYQRVSMPLDKKYAGKWARPAGHPDTAVLIHASAASAQRPEGTIISCPGGWYDAGDYNKYIVNSGISMGTLLSAYEDFPAYFDTLHNNIPESDNAVPDLLDEAIYNLRWMLTMQDPQDGGVYHKCTNAGFDGMVMPGATKLPRYVVQKGTAATLDFAAVMAQAGRILEAFGKALPGLSDSCKAAAVRAWQWAEKNPAIAYDQTAMNSRFEPKVTTGAYGDRHFEDEWFWAASELLVTTMDERYYQTISAGMEDTLSLPSWSNVYLLGYYTLLRHKKQLLPHAKDLQAAQKKLVRFADGYLQHVDENAFRTVMGQRKTDFIWGSNSVAANQSVLLINAWLITGERKYLGYALSNLDYLLGRNATGYCFLTGAGPKSTMHPHHRPSVADGIAEPVPGLLAGGPNPGMQDHCHYDFIEPETAYADTDCAYASNEIAINWNAPLVYLASAMEALQQELDHPVK